MAAGQRVGYVRVSTAEQNSARQLEGVQLDRVFEDKVSGKSMNRPQLALLLSFVREGDEVLVHSMDRLARNLDDLRKIVLGLTGRGVRVQFMKEGLSFTGDDSAISKLILSVMGACAEFDLALSKERQREGIAIAKAKGLYRGRKPSLTAEQVQQVRWRVEAGESKAELARFYGVSRETIYAHLRTGRNESRVLRPDPLPRDPEYGARWNRRTPK